MKALPPEFNQPISLDDEMTAVVDFLVLTWDFDTLQYAPPEPPRSALTSLVQRAIQSGYNALPSALDQHSSFMALHDARDAREEALMDQGGLGQDYPLHDGLCATYKMLSSGHFEIYQASDKARYNQLETKLNQLKQEVHAHFKGLSTIFPNDYARFTQNYREGQGMDTFDETSQAEKFHGHDCSSAGAGDLSYRLSLPQVAYDDLEQGRSPEDVLLNVLFAQGLKLRQYNNTVSFLRELSAFADNNQPFSYTLHEPTASQPMLSQLWSNVDPEEIKGFEPLTDEAIERMEANKAKWDALSPEEQVQRRKAVAEKIIAELKAEEPQP